MRAPELSARLQAVASLVRAGSRAADIGCDHGQLAAALVLSGRCPFVVAADLRPDPLAQARQLTRRLGLEGQIDCRLGDGLGVLRPGEVQDIILAGMGGETIADALAAAPWICSDAVSLVLQPVTSAAELRRFLAESGFALREELPVIDGRYCYTVLRAVWTGEKVSPGPLFCELGLLRGQRSPAAAACMARSLRRLSAELRGRRAAGQDDRPDALPLAALEQVCTALREELSQCQR